MKRAEPEDGLPAPDHSPKRLLVDDSAQDTSSSTTSSASGSPPPPSATAATTTMRLGSRLAGGRVVTRSKARGGDGFGTDTELLSATVLPQQQQPADSTAPGKGDLTRKPPALGLVANARLPVHTGTATAAPPAAAAPAPPPPAASHHQRPRHQRSNSGGAGGHIANATSAKNAQHQQLSEVAIDLACIADTMVKACADPQQQQEDEDHQLLADSSALQRRSARLAAAGVDASSSILAAAAVNTSSGGGSRPVNRSTSAGPVRQHKRATPASTNGRKAAVAAAAAGAVEEDDSFSLQQQLAPPPTAAPASSDPTSSSSGAAGSVSEAQRVRFAAGPLDPERHPHSTDDGHPSTEGAHAVPVRRLPGGYGMDLSKGNVLMLEQLLGTECSMSVTRLKRRVGLLPPIRPPRPHANSNSSPTAGGPAAAAAAAAGSGGRRR